MRTRTNTSVARLAALAKLISDAEEKLTLLNEKMNDMNDELKTKAEQIEEKDQELRYKTQQLAVLDNDIQRVLDIGTVQKDDNDTKRPAKRIVLDDGETITDLSGCEYIWEAMGWEVE
ncbi:hypothetical protein EDC01DRAFT_630747 [Geopyxis carbonaria]|nr:hypothetical protein EDC01DRAFT_630747 [Geopyxis carbonaria]